MTVKELIKELLEQDMDADGELYSVAVLQFNAWVNVAETIEYSVVSG